MRMSVTIPCATKKLLVMSLAHTILKLQIRSNFMNKQQLAAKIWASANEMRSKIEASEYKDYILGFIFYKFLSEKEEIWLRDVSAKIPASSVFDS